MDTLKAEQFKKNNARPLEKALYDYYFGNGTRQQAVCRIMDFQNDDCGFGNAIEPDISWQWDNDYKEFAKAREYWRPRITLDKLLFYRYNA